MNSVTCKNVPIMFHFGSNDGSIGDMLDAWFGPPRRLYERGPTCRGLAVDPDGVMLGPNCPLVQRIGTGYQPLGKHQMAHLLRRVFAFDGDVTQPHRQITDIARALEDGQLLRAQLLGLQVLPGPLDDWHVAQLAKYDMAKYDPDEPRDTRGRWVRLTNGPYRSELKDLVERIANARAATVAALHREIEQRFTAAGDPDGGQALHAALEDAAEPGLSDQDRQQILDRIAPYARVDPAEMSAMRQALTNGAMLPTSGRPAWSEQPEQPAAEPPEAVIPPDTSPAMPKAIRPIAEPDATEIDRLAVDPHTGTPKPAEARAAAQLQTALKGRLERVSQDEQGDFIFTDGPQAGRSVDFMFTTRTGSSEEVANLNRFFPKNFDRTIEQLQDHLAKSDLVPLDYRNLTQENQEALDAYIETLNGDDRARILRILK